MRRPVPFSLLPLLTTVWTLLAVVAAAIPLAAQLPPARVQWSMVETDNFAVLTDGSPRRAEAVASNLEALHSVLANIAARERKGPKTLVYAFERAKTFERYSPYQDAGSVAGFFTNSLLRNYISIDLSKDQRGSTVYHELLHEFAATNFPGVPLWFNEGLAEYYSTFTVAGSTAEVGRVVGQHIRWLRMNDLLPVRMLFDVRTDSPAYNEGMRRGIFYAQSWAAVHYLLSSNERAAQLRGFLSGLDRGESAEVAFGAAFDINFEQFDKELVRYVDGRSFQFSKLSIDAADLELKTRRMSRIEALSRLGELLVAVRKADQARVHLQAALSGSDSTVGGNATDSQHRANARGTLGWLAWQEGNERAAREQFELATKDPNSVAPRLYQGILELNEVVSTVPVGAGDSEHESIATAQRALSEALELEPDWPRAQVALGMTYLYGGEANQGVEILLRATELRPADPEPWIAIALLRAKLGQFTSAWNLLDQLESSLGQIPAQEFGPRRLSDARGTVAMFQTNRAANAYNEGDFDRALALAASLAGNLPTGELTRYQPILDNVRNGVREARALERLNHLIHLANSGRYQETLDELDALIEEGVLSNDATRHARDLRRRLVEQLNG